MVESRGDFFSYFYIFLIRKYNIIRYIWIYVILYFDPLLRTFSVIVKLCLFMDKKLLKIVLIQYIINSIIEENRFFQIISNNGGKFLLSFGWIKKDMSW